VAQEHRARAEALENVSRPARMLAQELEAIGWAAASDERLLDRLGWTRTRVIQVIGELRDEGLVQMREERRGRGRPRKLFRVVPAAEFTPRSDPDTTGTLAPGTDPAAVRR
jgi:predicted ArsR family transcriptional regulator